MFIIKDEFKFAIEQVTGGRMTVIRDAFENPHIMYRLLTKSGQPVYVGAYLIGGDTSDGLTTLPNNIPHTGVSLSNAIYNCNYIGGGTGNGFHLMTKYEHALLIKESQELLHMLTRITSAIGSSYNLRVEGAKESDYVANGISSALASGDHFYTGSFGFRGNHNLKSNGIGDMLNGTEWVNGIKNIDNQFYFDDKENWNTALASLPAQDLYIYEDSGNLYLTATANTGTGCSCDYARLPNLASTSTTVGNLAVDLALGFQTGTGGTPITEEPLNDPSNPTKGMYGYCEANENQSGTPYYMKVGAVNLTNITSIASYILATSTSGISTNGYRLAYSPYANGQSWV